MEDAALDLSHLSEEERQKIESVLKRDEAFTHQEEQRIRILKVELHDLRRKGVIKESATEGGGNCCARCRQPMGRLLFNSGQQCPKCQHQVCPNCLLKVPNKDYLLCTVCLKQREVKLKSGDWFYQGREASDSPRNYGTEIVQKSLHRSIHQSSRDRDSVEGEEDHYEVGSSQDHQNYSPEERMDPHRLPYGEETGQGGPQLPYGEERGSQQQQQHYDEVENGGLVEVANRVAADPAGPQHYRAEGQRSPQARPKSDDRSAIRHGGRLGAADWVDGGGGDDGVHSSSRQDSPRGPRRSPERLTGQRSNHSPAKSEAGGRWDSPTASRHSGPGGGGGDGASHHSGSSSLASGKSLLEMAKEYSSSDRNDNYQEPTANHHQGNHRPNPAITVSGPTDSEDVVGGEEEEDIDRHFRSQSATSTPSRSYGRKHGGSMESISSFDTTDMSISGQHVTITGDIKFGLSYNFKVNVFEIKVVSCRDLAPVDTKKNLSNPYVKAYLMPDKTKSGKRKTRIKKHTLNPHYDEIIKYHLGQSELETRTLVLSVWHRGTLGHNLFLGEVQLPLEDVDLDESSLKWYPLRDRKPEESGLTYKGDLTLALKYIPPGISSAPPVAKASGKSGGKKGKQTYSDVPTGYLLVDIKEAKNLVSMRLHAGFPDSFVKCYLLPDKSKRGKFKTDVARRNPNPTYNKKFSFEGVGPDDLRDCALEVTVWDHESFMTNHFVGSLRFCLGTGFSFGKEVLWNNASSKESALWQKLMDQPNIWVEDTLQLRSHINTPTKE